MVVSNRQKERTAAIITRTRRYWGKWRSRFDLALAEGMLACWISRYRKEDAMLRWHTYSRNRKEWMAALGEFEEKLAMVDDERRKMLRGCVLLWRQVVQRKIWRAWYIYTMKRKLKLWVSTTRANNLKGNVFLAWAEYSRETRIYRKVNAAWNRLLEKQCFFKWKRETIKVTSSLRVVRNIGVPVTLLSLQKRKTKSAVLAFQKRSSIRLISKLFYAWQSKTRSVKHEREQRQKADYFFRTKRLLQMLTAWREYSKHRKFLNKKLVRMEVRREVAL